MIVAFYAKTYFLVAAPFLASYIFLFESKKQGLLFTGIFSGLFLLSVWIIDALYETYFSNVFFNHINYNIDDPGYLLLQCKEYVKHSGGLCLLGVMAIFWAGSENEKSSRFWNFHGLNAPLFLKRIPLAGYIAVWVILLFVCRMGQHQGAWLTYLFQLLTPFLLLWALPSFKKIKGYSRFPVFATLLSLNLVVASFPYLSNVSRVEESRKEWDLLLSLMEPASNVLNSPIFALERIKAGKKVYDTGNSEHFQYGGERQGVWAMISDPQPAIREQWLKYKNRVQEDVLQGKFDLVAIDRGPRFMADEGLFLKTYTLMVTIPIQMPHATMHHEEQRVDIGIWEAEGRERPLAEKYKIYRALYACHPEDFFINFYLGFQLVEGLKDYKNGVTFLERAAALDPNMAVVPMALGTIYFHHLRDYHRALRHFQRAHALLPSDAAIRTKLGLTYRMLGDEVNARKYLGPG